MLHLTQIKMPVVHTEEDLERKIRKALRLSPDDHIVWKITKRSLDARKKGSLQYIYSVSIETSDDKAVLRDVARQNKGKKARAGRKPSVQSAPVCLQGGMELSDIQDVEYRFPDPGEAHLEHRPVIIGSGPAGLFAAWMLAKYGYCPVVLEMGDPADIRLKKIEKYWETGILDPDSNVQFGEGGAGTFSDGKLNTGVKDPSGRNLEVLRIFVQAGAPQEILYESRPHVGTDILIRVVQTMRQQICEAGGEVHFRSKVTDLVLDTEGTAPQIRGVITEDGRTFASEHVILAIGHSSRFTFRMLSEKPLRMEPKSFAVGVRIEHPQEMINSIQYGPQASLVREAASYRLAAALPDGRKVYTFCMCPGGFVVNASSEQGYLAVNGMSYHARDSRNANSAVIVSVTPDDFRPYHREGTSEALDGMYFQYALEKAAFRLGDGMAPVQRFEDFCLNREGEGGLLVPCHKGLWKYANVRSVFPDELALSLEKGIYALDRKMPGFAMPDTLLTGVESRTSSPIRILRDPTTLESSIRGLFPCGEGAGYAGGITSAAMDGLRIAERIGAQFQPVKS